MTAATVNEPVPGYDGLKTRDLIAALSSHSQTELAAIETYERAHRNRKTVFSKLRRLRHGGQRLQEHNALSTDEVVAALRRFRARGVEPVARDVKR
jgi:N-acetyl-gamma-glutamylphosphate reductase